MRDGDLKHARFVWVKRGGVGRQSGSGPSGCKATPRALLSRALRDRAGVAADIPSDEDLTAEPVEDHKPFVTVSSGMRGSFAVLVFWDKEGGIWDVWQTGIGSYPTALGAIQEAHDWADAEGLEFRP